MLDKDEYQMSEKAFLNVWNKYGCPEEINGVKECYSFMEDIMSETRGLVIVDHFSGMNYDHIERIELRDNLILIYWKDFELNPLPEEWLYEVFGYVTYKYTLCDLRKIKFFNVDGHLYVLFMPNVISVDKAQSLLGTRNLERDKEVIIDDLNDDFEIRFRFIRENKIHECTIAKFPYYSFLIQPKERELHTGFSNEILMLETLRDAKSRLNAALHSLRMVDEHDVDGISSSGNRVRTILESVIKYYCLHKRYSLPLSNYGDNLLGKLRKHLKDKKDSLIEIFSNELLREANEFSHDSGILHSKIKVRELVFKVDEIIEEIFKRSSKILSKQKGYD